MERNTEIKTLSFSKGMTNIPSDLLCEDSELTESDGFIYRDGEMKPIQKPKNIGKINKDHVALYMHKRADYANLITYCKEENCLYWYEIKNKEVVVPDDESNNKIAIAGNLTDINAVGNTLLVATDIGINYIFYKGGVYKNLGKELPKPHVEFSSLPTNTSVGDSTVCELKELISSEKKLIFFNTDGTISSIKEHNDNHGGGEDYFTYKMSNDKEKKDSAQDAIHGHVMNQVRLIKEKNCFCFPFFLRYALRLFDGTYARISNPIAYFPTVNRNCRFVPAVYNNGWKETDYATETFNFWCHLMYTTPLKFKVEFTNLATRTDIKKWSDIVKDVVVFASDDVMPFNIDKDWSFKNALEVQGDYYYNIVEDDASGTSGTTSANAKWNFNKTEKDVTSGRYERPKTVIVPSYKTDKEIIDEMVTKSQFYKLFEVGISDREYIDNGFNECPIKKNVVSNLTEQEQLSKDDYYGWTSMSASKMFSYNSRINLFSIKRYPFEGFNYFEAPIIKTNDKDVRTESYKCFVHIVSEQMDRWVESDYFPCVPEMTASWVFYPDPNATEMLIYYPNNDSSRLITLSKHKLLNGAYSFEALPFPKRTRGDLQFNGSHKHSNMEGYETFDSNIYTSVVNNPFVFEASGDNTVGTGKILGIVANTEAVSQGQFGQYPLLVFTDEGIYGMSVNSEGLYSATYPISREVCLENSPLTPTDRLVYFTSNKGLMAASGGSVGCMSEQIRGCMPRNFATLGDGRFVDFLKDCLIAYDYRDSMLRIFNKDKDYQYIYNMVDKTFSMVNSGMVAQAVVNDYPDNLIQDADGNVFSLTEKPDINDDENLYSGTITTRPLKLGGSMTLKSLRDIRHLRSTQTGKLSLEIWASNNAVNWCQLHSLKGKPWSYFTFKYTLTDFKACDSFQGSVVVIQNRRSLLRGQN